MNIWLVSLFENTPLDDNQNTRYNSIVKEAVSRKHEVTFWAVTFRHNTKQQRFPSTIQIDPEENLKVIYVKSPSYNHNISIRRLYSHHLAANSIIKAFNTVKHRPDVILIAFPPISTAFQISNWATRNKIPYIIDIIDPWPDIFEAPLKKFPPSFTARLLRPMRKRVEQSFSSAAALTAISKQYLEWSNKYLIDELVQQCFYPAIQLEEMRSGIANAQKRSANSEQIPFTVVYAGSLGHSYDLPTIIEAAALIEGDHGDHVKFVIAGDGPQKHLVKAYEADHRNLKYLGRVSKDELMYVYSQSQLGLTQHIKGATQSVTYKLFDLLGAGLPILNSLESEMKEIILSNEVGLHNSPGDTEKLAKNIVHFYENPDDLERMKKNALELTARLGDSKNVYSDFVDLIEKIAIANH